MPLSTTALPAALLSRTRSINRHLRAFTDRRRDPGGKKDAVLHIAVRMFLERGFWRTSLSDIAARLQITKPALYHYFRNKEEIYLACYRRGISLIQADLEELHAASASGLEKLTAFIYRYAIVIASDFGRFVVRQDDRELSPEARSEVRSYKRQVDRSLRKFIQSGIDDRSIRACDVKLAAFSIAGAVNSMAVWFEPAGKMSAPEVAAEFARTLTSCIAQRRENPFRLPPLAALEDDNDNGEYGKQNRHFASS